ncbi:hypothetical protein HWC26_gp125 [Aeromonas phage 2L372X]|uniref:Uncharacterized protein n=2 Tax=Plateaulakevirus TaxID=2843436 RepID=A0A5B9N2I4_9CAUD|nr:hypothetical protein HWC25_gp126 [Aeromonas phage 2L372D]YP_009846462.1 hypothetical protein HWC26_gp125 [Aeromonas phage 2L372X]QDB74040.1 hypothetical protein 2L372D_126 [Aeromonas phage 2L372D]QEG08377.1 hypothetical protein [Aeromonas phage 2L372X]
MRCWTGETITKLEPDYIFVFGSNPEGRHGAGAALAALKFGAKYGVGRGLQGQTYALVTKNLKEGFVEKLSDGTTKTYPKAGYRSISKEDLIDNIKEFYDCAEQNKHLKFFVAYNKADSKNLNGYSSKEMFEMLTSYKIPDNVYLHSSFRVFEEEIK